MNTHIKNIKDYFNKQVVLKGFVENIRDLQYVQFLVLRDVTGKVQLTIEKNEDNKKLTDLVSNLTLESTITVNGLVKQNEKVKLNQVEIIPSDIKVTSNSLSELPIDIKDRDKALRETRLDYRFLDLRKEENLLLFKSQTLIEHSIREYFIENNFIEIHSPKITAANAESGAEVFKLDYFKQEACLSQSPQFYKQMAMASGFDKVFEIGPAFRAENSHTSYHATEINMIDMEISWIENYEEIMDVQENMLRHAFTKLKEKYQDDILEKYKITLTGFEKPFPRITFEEAKKIVKEKYNYTSENVDDLDRKEEVYLYDYVKKTYDSDFVFVTLYPYSARPFYHMIDSKGHSYSYDLLYKGIEITTGAQREHRPEVLIKQIKEKGVDPKTLDFYVDFFKYGCPPHGGFGFGMARLLMKIFDIDNIREATFIYRGPNRLTP